MNDLRSRNSGCSFATRLLVPVVVLAALLGPLTATAQPFTGIAGFGWAWYDADRVQSCAHIEDTYRLDLPAALPLERRDYMHQVGAIAGYGVWIDVVEDRVVGVNASETAAHQRLGWFFRTQLEAGRRPCLMMRSVLHWKGQGPLPAPFPSVYAASGPDWTDSMTQETLWTDPGQLSGTLDVGGVRLTWTAHGVDVEPLRACCSATEGCRIELQSRGCPPDTAAQPLAETAYQANAGLCARCRPGEPRTPPPTPRDDGEPPPVCCINGRTEHVFPDTCTQLLGGTPAAPGTSCGSLAQEDEPEPLSEPLAEPPVPAEPFGGCCDQLGMCSVASEADCRAPLDFLSAGCGNGCPVRGACRDVPCPRSTDTLCAETTEATCTSDGGTFDPGGACDPRQLVAACPSSTPCDVLDGTTWFDSCNARISFSIEGGPGSPQDGGTLVEQGREDRGGTWRCGPSEHLGMLDIAWSDGSTEQRELMLIDGYRLAFVEPGRTRLRWLDEPVPETRSGAALREVARNGQLFVELQVANCSAEPLQPSLRWRGVGDTESADAPTWLEATRIRSAPGYLPPRTRGIVRFDVTPTPGVEPGDWTSVSAQAQGTTGALMSEHLFLRVLDKRIESRGLLLEKLDASPARVVP